ncbi:EscU/YscU/HrcU family type III secretion system export apparatus switch protein [Pseudomonas sp. NPDC090202]|uniref:EscU/YscU/HrcU family type III secretion system export apparatus switch protein n=1 Tax=unclassified Pseudomonas TaxID=196821 RepID=UPI0038021C64
MSSASKTEKPTPKKRRDSARKGQVFKAKDLVTSCLMICGVGYVLSQVTLIELMVVYRQVIASQFDLDAHALAVGLLLIALKTVLPVILICTLAAAVPALLQSGFSLAFEALKLNLDAINPVNGFKKLFSLRTVKDSVKALLYLCSFAIACWVVWLTERQLIFVQLHMQPAGLFDVWGRLLLTLVLTFLACVAVIVVLDALAEYWLYIKDLKMDKQSVKREQKEQDGNPEIKRRRRDLHLELLSEQIKSDIAGSRVIIANPTHIAIGIYFRPEITPLPFISLIETNQRALAVRTHAAKVGVPVVTDISLARRIFRTHSRYSFVQIEEIEQVLRLLVWLEQVEQA